MAKCTNMRECPICGEQGFCERRGEFRFDPPPNIPAGTIVIADAVWEECEACGEQIIGHELDQALDAESRRRQGLLSPSEIKAIRERVGLSQAQIAGLMGVGSKTYTRWETGKSIQNKSNDNLIRLINQDPSVLARLEAQRRPDRRKTLDRYFDSLGRLKGANEFAVAAHGIELGTTITRRLRGRLRELMTQNTHVLPREAEPGDTAGFRPSFLEIESHELVHYLLEESGQSERRAVNPAGLLSFLGLEHVSFDFELELPPEVCTQGHNPRALLSFPDRLVATHERLHHMQERFSVLHEIAHFVLPSHEYSLYLDDDDVLRFQTNVQFEREANEFAADLLFQGDRFTLEANNQAIAAKSVKKLGTKYDASFEATARRLVERNLRSAMLVVFKRDSGAAVDDDQERTWSVRYCATSPTFRNRYFTEVKGTVPAGIVRKLSKPDIDIADSERIEIRIPGEDGTEEPFAAEFFTNTYNIFCLLTPVEF